MYFTWVLVLCWGLWFGKEAWSLRYYRQGDNKVRSAGVFMNHGC